MLTFVTLMITNMNTRLKQFISAENITQAQFADNINVVRASVSHILAGRNKPGYEFISGLMRYYPNLNLEWLMFGKGKMYKDAHSEAISQENTIFSNTDEVENEYTDLFSSAHETSIPEIVQTPQEPAKTIQKTAPPQVEHSSGVTLSDIQTLINTCQKPVNQRKLIKITAFFDDGTFQELTSIL